MSDSQDQSRKRENIAQHPEELRAALREETKREVGDVDRDEMVRRLGVLMEWRFENE